MILKLLFHSIRSSYINQIPVREIEYEVLRKFEYKLVISACYVTVPCYHIESLITIKFPI